MQPSEAGGVEFHDFHPDLGDFRQDVLAGLRASPKRIPPKYFYDRHGSYLFEKICELPEYYLTLTETAILRERADEITELVRHDPTPATTATSSNGECDADPEQSVVLIEYGSGSGRKTRILLDALKGRGTYVPIDISKQHLLESAAEPASLYPELRVVAICADYSKAFTLPPDLSAAGKRRVAFFPGSTIGNLDPAAAVSFLKRIVNVVGPGGAMLLGVDLKKDGVILHAAYNDDQGVTAEFNLNLLVRVNRELGANFDLGSFRHKAFYNDELGRIEMHLESLRDQTVELDGRSIVFRQGETIHTENSYKYTVEEMRRLASRAGFRAGPVWTDDARFFSVHYLTVGGWGGVQQSGTSVSMNPRD